MQYINVCLSFFGAWKVDSGKLISLPPHGLEGLWIMLAFTSSLEALLSIHACPGHRNLFPHWSGWWLDDSAGKGGPLLRLYKSIGAQQVGFGNWYNAVFSHWDVDGPKLKTRDTTVVLVMLLFLFSQYIAVHPSHPHLRPVAAPSCCGPVALASCSSFGKKKLWWWDGSGFNILKEFWRSSVYFRWNWDGLVISIGFTTFYSGLWWLFLFDGPVPPLLSYFHCSWSVGQWLPQDPEDKMAISIQPLHICGSNYRSEESWSSFPPFGSEWKWWTRFVLRFQQGQKGRWTLQHPTQNTHCRLIGEFLVAEPTLPGAWLWARWPRDWMQGTTVMINSRSTLIVSFLKANLKQLNAQRGKDVAA